MSTQVQADKRVLLPKGLVPTNYDLSITPDMEAFTFKGTVAIALRADVAVNEIVLNAVGLEFTDVQLHQGGSVTKVASDEVKFNDVDDTATIGLSVKVGKAVLTISYSGSIKDDMRGFYRSKYTHKGKDHYIGSTQFESVDARRALPCWDEPAVKATFDVTLIVANHLIALSNMPEKSVKAVDEKTKCVVFQRSPIMSSYLLAWAIGEFDRVQAHTTNGTWVSIYTQLGETDKVLWALDVSLRVLPLFEKYFEIPYPLPKLDLIAIPEFACGAMENWGLITYRESCLFCDETTSQRTREWITETVTHEISHQWFGNLVTMEWWSQLWLNEGFASFMQVLSADWMYPEWNLWAGFYRGTIDYALALDALESSHPIEVEVSRAQESEEVFDTISYSKGGAVVGMIHHYLGADVFRKAIHKYLDHFQYSNAVTADLWKFLSQESNQDVNKIMSNFTSKQGFPVIEVSELKEEGKELVCSLKQTRFLSSGRPSPENDDVVWSIPIVINVGGEDSQSVLMDTKTMEIRLPSTKWLKFNSNATGVYRVRYSDMLFKKLVEVCRTKELEPVDRLNIVSDSSAMARAGYAPTSSVLALLSVFHNEDDQFVWSSITDALSQVSGIVQHTKYLKLFCKFSCDLLKIIHASLGWDAKENESQRTVKLRATIINALLSYDDSTATSEAQKRFNTFCETKTGISPDFRVSVFKSVIRHGGKDYYYKVRNLAAVATSPEEEVMVYSAIGATTEPDLVRETLEWSIGPNVRKQDSVYVMRSLSRNIHATEAVWKWFQTNYDLLRKEFPQASLFSSFVCVADAFCSREKADEIKDFFQTKDCLGFERYVKQSIEVVTLRALYLERDHDDILNWLNQWNQSKL
uniref:Aminopeptidase n=2 Tax=Hirondellea gigas TaxID=1518452 RepID=A0A6A7FZR5_9CRUS